MPVQVDKEPCPICLDEAGEFVRMGKCKGHAFHRQCLALQMGAGSSIRCALCGTAYGLRTGSMPPGEMTWRLRPYGKPCEGFEDVGTWEITYDLCNKRGGRRTAYLPDTKEGRQILSLFVVAFERKLTFSVGRSLTTGLPNSVIWAGIHHKTSTTQGPFGYPDP